MSFTGDRKLITSQPCSVRGCHHMAYILYNIGGVEKKPICKSCQRRMMDEYLDSRVKEFQLRFHG